MSLSTRLARVAKAVRDRPRADQFGAVEAVPVGDATADGRPPGLYHSGPPGSTCGLLVFDPADGEPVVPAGRLAPWGLLIVLGPEAVEPPREWPGRNG